MEEVKNAPLNEEIRVLSWWGSGIDFVHYSVSSLPKFASFHKNLPFLNEVIMYSLAYVYVF